MSALSAWIMANKSHIVAVGGAAYAAWGYFYGGMTADQVKVILAGSGAISLITSDVKQFLKSK